MPGRPVGVDKDQWGGGGVLPGHEVEAEVADVGAPHLVDDHVVERVGGQVAEVGMLDDGAVGLAAQDPPVLHGHDEQAPVR